MDRIVIVGAGQAAFQLVLSLRQNGFQGAIALVGDEGRAPYQRPPLSKDVLKGVAGEDDLGFRPDSFYADASVELRLADRAVSIDREAATVGLSSGEALGYDQLVLATGARNRVPPIPGVARADVLGLRTCADALRLAEGLKPGLAFAVIGAGFIGLEFASVASAKGCRVTVIETASRAMSRSLSPTMADYLVGELRAAGVNFRFGAPVAEIVGGADGRTSGVRAGGEIVSADRVLLSAGVVPNVELAAAAGLDVSRGVVVDADLRTPDPRISAIGDCASYPSERCGSRLLLESVQNATGQARHLAARLAGRPTGARYDDVPWFWSEIGGRKLQIAGAAIGADAWVLRGDPGAARFSVFCYAGDRLVAVESVNAPAEHMLGRKLVDRPHALAPAEAADPAFDLKAALA